MTLRINIFTGNANPTLAQKIAKYLQSSLGDALISQFSDGESRVEILESVRGQDVFIIQSTCAPANNNLMELFLMADALCRASALRITAIIPYFGYARQDKRIGSTRVPIAAKMAADLLAAVGINRVITVDLHAEQIQGFFSIPVDNVYGSQALLDDMIEKRYPNPIIISPDIGGVVRAQAFAKRLNHADLAIIDKRRSQPNQSKVVNIIGTVKNRICVIVDDMVDTGGTLCAAAIALKQQGASKVVAYCTHPVLSGDAVKAIENAPLDELVVTDTIPLKENAIQCKRIRQLSIAPMLAEVIRRVRDEESVSSLFS